MKASEFVEQLKNIAPSLDLLVENFRASGGTEMAARRFFESFVAKPKEIWTEYNNELINLIGNYDVTFLEIGSIMFNERITWEVEKCIIGRDEIDPIAFRQDTGEVFVIDFYDHDFIMLKCAKNGEAFLDALIVCAGFLAQRTLNDQLEQNEIAARIAAGCADRAGGPEYLDFYSNILGVQ